jgi:hypothetical protein
LLFALDFIIGKTLKHFFYKQKSGRFFSLTYILNNSNEDIFILGSSRAIHHYDPEIITKVTGLSVYNCGSGGQALLFSLAEEKAILSRIKPKMVILDLIPYAISKTPTGNDSYSKLSILSPYYNDLDVIRPIIVQKSQFEKYKYISQIYPYNSLIYDIFKSNILNNRKLFNGYEPLFINIPQWEQDSIKRYKAEFDSSKINNEYPKFIENLDSVLLNSLYNIIEDCKSKNVKIVICVSPICFPDIDTRCLSLFLKNDIKIKESDLIIDYSTDIRFSMFFEYYKDMRHLNQTGAKYFTQIFTDDLIKRNILK